MCRVIFEFVVQGTKKVLYPLDKKEKRHNRQIALQRIGNEHAIGLIKRFRMVAGRYRNRLQRFALRFTLIAAICNFEMA